MAMLTEAELTATAAPGAQAPVEDDKTKAKPADKKSK
jgi:hypothetical protein